MEPKAGPQEKDVGLAIFIQQPQKGMNAGGAVAVIMRGGENRDSLTEA